MTTTDILFLIAFIIVIAIAIFLIVSFNTPSLKDMTKDDIETPNTGVLTPHIQKEIDKIEIELKEIKTQSLTEQPSKKKRKYTPRKKIKK